MYKNQRRKSFRTTPYNEAIPNKRRSLHFICPMVDEEVSDKKIENISTVTENQNELILSNDIYLNENEIIKSNSVDLACEKISKNDDLIDQNLNNSFSNNDNKDDKCSQNVIKLSQVTVDTDSELDKIICDLDDNTFMHPEKQQLIEDDNKNDPFENNLVESDNDSLFDDLEDNEDFDEFLISKKNNLDKTLTQIDMNDIYSDNNDENCINSQVLHNINFKSASGSNIEIKMSENEQLNLWKKIFGK